MPVTKDSVYSTRFNMVMLLEERAMLQARARQAGLKESDIFRQMIRNYAAELGAKKPGKPKPARRFR